MKIFGGTLACDCTSKLMDRTLHLLFSISECQTLLVNSFDSAAISPYAVSPTVKGEEVI